MSGLRRAASAAFELRAASSSSFRACCGRIGTSSRFFVPVARARLYSSGPSIPSSPGAGPSRPSRRKYYLLALPLALLPFTLFKSSRKPLDPYTYSDHELGTSTRITAQHAQLAIPLSDRDAALFRPSSSEGEGEGKDEGGIVSIQHVMIKNPDLQIERPYTPINDVGKDGQIELVVKRVKGGEVGRMIYGLQPGATVGVRGPLNTLSFRPADYDRIVMVSTGTGVAPFLQLLRKIPPGGSTSPEMHLIHSAARDSALDFLEAPALLSPRDRDKLRIDRPPPGPIPVPMLEQALSVRKEGKKVLVLVCLPQNLMRPLCGGLTIDMKQGPITGTLGQMGLTNAEVYKLE